MKNATGCLAFLLLCTSAAFAQAGPSPAPAPNADDIYWKAVARLKSLPEPAYIDYTLDVEGSVLHRSGRTVSQVVVRTTDGVAFAHTISEDGKPPPTSEPLDSISERSGGLGPDFLAVMQRDAGKKPAHGSIFGLSLDAMATPEPGVVRAVYNSHYEVRLAGVDAYPPCAPSAYHLTLRPRHQSEDDPVREMWIDTSTFNLCKVSLGIMVSEGVLHAPVSANVVLSAHGPYWMADTLNVEGHTRFMLLSASMALHARFSQIGFPQSEPAWMFDRDLYAVHTGHKAGSGFSFTIH